MATRPPPPPYPPYAQPLIDTKGLVTKPWQQFFLALVHNTELNAYVPVSALQPQAWTPLIGGTGGQIGQTYTTQEGSWTQVGQLIFASFAVQLRTKGTISGTVVIGGLPVAASSALGTGSAANLFFDNLASNWISLVALMAAGTTYAEVGGTQTTGQSNKALLTTADLTNTSDFRGMLTYGL